MFYSGDWAAPEELLPSGYFGWYMSMMWKEDLPQNQLEGKYASPFGENTGWFFPQQYFEPAVQRYFDVSTEHLRSDSIYYAQHEGYYIGTGGGIGATPEIVLQRVEKEGDLRRLYITLDYNEQNVPGMDEEKVLTATIQEDGSYRFTSYRTSSAL